MENILGQTNAIRFLRGNIATGRAANSYLFSGPEGVGRATCARAFIAALLCQERTENQEACMQCSSCRRIEGLKHPDLTWIKPEKNKAIKISEIRSVKDVLSLKPYEASFSVCVIEDAHMMTPEAANALLKVLEEPPGNSLLILITNKKELLLETVISRCAEVRFRFLSADDTKDIIIKNAPDVDESTAEFLAYFSQGSPGEALTMINEDLAERKEAIIDIVDSIMRSEDPACLSWDSENRDLLMRDIEMLIMIFRDVAMKKEGFTEHILDKTIMGKNVDWFSGGKTIEKIYNIIERLIGIKRALAGNINPKLAAQVLPAQIKV